MALIERTLIRVTLFGALTGLLAGVIVLGFRWLIEGGQAAFLPETKAGNFEALDPWIRFFLPVAGGAVLGWIFQHLSPQDRQVGVGHVLNNLRTAAGGRLPLKNAVIQFFGGAAAIISGQSVDREGPGVHLGSTCGSQLADRFGFSRRDSRTLIACGAAAAVAAAFNTPLAGAIFGIEVMRFRYNIARFMPVIMASVIGAVVIRVVHGPSPSFSVPPLNMNSMLELPLLALLGLAIGLMAGLFIMGSELVARRCSHWTPLAAFTVAGLCTGLLGSITPQIMGIGYDTLDAMLKNNVTLSVLFGIVCFKLIATAVAVGLKVPGGLIGPTLVMGGAMGSLMGLLYGNLIPFETGSPAFYAVIGMMAMMGATLQAPLSALIALLELTATPNIILPGMMAVVTADLVVRLIMRRESIFVTLLRVNKSAENAGRLS